jgi:hypothetical protein
MDDLYYINFQSNDKFYKICNRYKIIHDWSTIDHLKKWCKVEFSYEANIIDLEKMSTQLE